MWHFWVWGSGFRLPGIFGTFEAFFGLSVGFRVQGILGSPCLKRAFWEEGGLSRLVDKRPSTSQAQTKLHARAFRHARALRGIVA